MVNPQSTLAMSTVHFQRARARLENLPSLPLGHLPSPVDEWARLRDAIGMKARLLAKRDDAIPFGFGGNKVRKLTLVAADALAQGADSVITCGGVQSNHCRATAAVAAQLGLACHVVANGTKPERATGNAFLISTYGAQVTHVATRQERAPTMERIAADLRSSGGRPFVIPLGASTPIGAMAIARGVGELVAQGIRPDVIVHASSSGGTQAGLIAGCALYAPATRVIGISADDPAHEIRAVVLRLVAGVESALDLPAGALGGATRCEVDDTFVGAGYGIPSDESRVAQELGARFEAVLTDHWYTAKALAGLINRARRGEFDAAGSVLFWHTGGQPSAIS
jgi:1-aminocyclopropane-1-carboxylate deaminase/D-cysteine desulfhydrase-like pyridoxal-dependent ACC family enzyme